MGATDGKDGAETSESDKAWMNSLSPGKDMSFKQYLEDIKRKHAYAEAMKAAKKRPPDEVCSRGDFGSSTGIKCVVDREKAIFNQEIYFAFHCQ